MRHLRHPIAIVALALLVTAVSPSPIVAQQPLEWSPAERVPGYTVEALAPYLVADGEGTVHAFNWQLVEDTIAVVYRQWTLEGGWTEPVDILLPTGDGQARVVGAHLDDRGDLHVIYYGGNDRSFAVYHSKAPAAAAGSAHSWSSPVVVAPNAGPLSHASLAADGEGNLFVLYSGRQAGFGLYAVQSSDWGETWSKPAVVYLTYSQARWAANIHAVTDREGVPHVVWTLVNDLGLGEKIYYSNLQPGSEKWSDPLVLASAVGMEVNAASIMEHESELFVIYHSGTEAVRVPSRWMRRSRDGGLSWMEPVQLFDTIGTNGPAAMAHDSAGRLHLVLANRRGPHPATHGAWHSVWQGDGWGELGSIASGPQVRSTDMGVEFDPWDPKPVVVRGNVLLVVWRTDPGVGPNGIWYSYTTLDSPELPVVPLPAPPAPEESAPVEAPPSLLETPDPLDLVGEAPPRLADPEIEFEEPNPALGWLLTVGSTAFLVLAVMAVRFSRLYTRR